MEHKKTTPTAIIILAIAILLGAIYIIRDNRSEPAPVDNTDHTPVTEAPYYKCGMTVNAPLPNSTVAFPLNVSGIINNLGATDNCTWTLFEGQGGMVTISNGPTTYATAPVMIAGDWMSTLPVNFSASLIPGSPIPSGTPLTITFAEEDPSGQGLGTTFSYQVIAQ